MNSQFNGELVFCVDGSCVHTGPSRRSWLQLYVWAWYILQNVALSGKYYFYLYLYGDKRMAIETPFDRSKEPYSSVWVRQAGIITYDQYHDCKTMEKVDVEQKWDTITKHISARYRNKLSLAYNVESQTFCNGSCNHACLTATKVVLYDQDCTARDTLCFCVRWTENPHNSRVSAITNLLWGHIACRSTYQDTTFNRNVSL